MKNYSIGEFAKKIGVTVQTLRDWHKKGELIPSYISQGGTRYYSSEQSNIFLGVEKSEEGKKITLGYFRVSSNKQND